MDRINEKLGAWLLPKERTKDELAAALEMTRPTLNTRLSGKSEWTWSEVLAIAKLTNSTPNELAGI